MREAAGLVVLGAVLGLLLALVLPKEYQARATVIFPRASGGSLLDLASRAADSDPNQALTTLAVSRGRQPTVEYASSILTSRRAARSVARSQRLGQRWGIEDEQAVLRKFSKKLQIQKLSRDNQLVIRFRDRDPRLAEEVLTGLLLEYNRYTHDHALTSIKKQRQFLELQLESSGEELKEAQEAWSEFQSREGTQLIRENAKIMTQLLAEQIQAKGELEELSTLVEGIQERKSQVAATLDSAPVFPVEDPLLQKLQTDLLMAEVEEENLLLARTPRHPDVVAAHARVENLRRGLETRRRELAIAYGDSLSPDLIQSRSQLEAAEAKDKKLQALMDQFTVEFQRVPPVEMKNLSLRRQYEVSEQVNRLLLIELHRARISEALDTVDLEVLDPPEADRGKPVFPRPTWFAAAGALLGLLAAGFLAYRRGHLRWDSASDSAMAGSTQTIPYGE